MLGDKFHVRSGHHESIKALWQSKWKFPVSFEKRLESNRRVLTELQKCGKGVYPFHDGDIKDFEPVFDFLIEVQSRLSPSSLRSQG